MICVINFLMWIQTGSSLLCLHVPQKILKCLGGIVTDTCLWNVFITTKVTFWVSLHSKKQSERGTMETSLTVAPVSNHWESHKNISFFKASFYWLTLRKEIALKQFNWKCISKKKEVLCRNRSFFLQNWVNYYERVRFRIDFPVLNNSCCIC